MPHFLQQVAYSQEGWEALVANPQNRIEAVPPAIENWEARLKPRGFPSETTTFVISRFARQRERRGHRHGFCRGRGM